MMKTALKAATVVLALGFNLSQDSDAEILLEFTEADGDVILYVSGTLDLTGLTESNKGAILGGATLLDTVNEQFQLGSGVAAPVNAFTLTVQNEVFSSTTDLFGTIDSWEANTNSIRFQQNNGQVLMDDEIEAGDVIEVTSTHTFSGLSFADFGLTQGDNLVWLENTNVDGDAGQVIVTAGLRDTGPSAPLVITAIDYSLAPNPAVTLTWSKTGAATYIAKYSSDMIDWDADLDDGITEEHDENPDDSEQITVTFPLLGVQAEALFFRIEEG